MNRTELRVLSRGMGNRPLYRNTPTNELEAMLEPAECFPATQEVIRAKTEAFVQRHWTVLSETLKCQGDCSSPDNRCTDAQSQVCYSQNKSLIDG